MKLNQQLVINFFVIFCVVFGLISCNAERQKEEALRKKIIGEWTSQSLDIKIKSINNSNSDSIISADESNWEKVLSIKPIHTVFNEDSTYYSVYKSLNDKVVGRPAGKWYIKRDTLFVVQGSPQPMTIKYFIDFKDSTSEFRGMLDFDDDGANDDEFVSINKYNKKKDGAN